MSIAAEELRNQLSQTKKNAENPEEAENRGLSLLSTFPWFYEILRKCREYIGTKHPNTLNGLLYTFVKELYVSIKDCYSRPNRAGKLRDLVCQMLVYFNMIDRDLKEDCLDNNNTYLHLMTELLAMYLDLEIKASKRSVHSLKKIGQFMATALYTHLGRSEDHMVEAILKAKLITKSSGELCAPVLCKILKDGKCFIGDENAYVRFLLAFKLLQKVTRRTDRYVVTRMAMRKLNPAPELVTNVRRMNNIFPQQKIMDEPITVFLMNAKFDFIKAKLEFLRTGSITKGGPCEIFQEKPFSYENQSDSVTDLLKQYEKDERNDTDKKIYSADFDLDPSIYKLSLHASDGSENNKYGRNEDGNGEIEFLGTQNKMDKPVTLITLNSDDETEENSVAEKAVDNATPSDSNKDAGDTSSKIDKDDFIVRDSLDMKSESHKQKTSKRFVPESDGAPDSGEKEENSSTKHAGGLLPSMLQSPEHGVIESTNNFIDSVWDDSFRSPIRKSYDAHSNTDEGRTEVSSSLDFVDSTVDLFNEDYFKTREPEITSTRDKSESFSSTGDDLSNLTNDLYSALNFNSHGKSWDIACAESAHGFFPSDKASDVKNSVVTSGFSTQENGSRESEYCSSTSWSNMQQNSERMSIIHNYSQNDAAQSQRRELCDVDSAFSKQNVKPISHQPGVIQRTNESNIPMGVAIESKQIQQHHVNGKELDCYRSFCIQPLASDEGKVSQIETGEIGSKNRPVVSGNLDNIIGTPAKKANYENVLKSYKIVKSKSLKPTELPRSPVEQSKDASGRNAVRATKFIKVEKSGLIGNSLKVEEGVKFVSKSLDFRTSKSAGGVSKRGRAEGVTGKTVEGNSVGSRTWTSQCVPIIFKKIEETKRQATERKRKSSQGGGSGEKYSKSNQTSKRKQKSHTSNVIKTDINMKSTLRHINTSSIPQFATEVLKDCPGKYQEMELGPATVKCISNYAPADTEEKGTVGVKLAIPDKYLELKSSEAFVNQGNEPSVTPVMRPETVQYPPNYERTSYAPIPRADSTQENSFNQFPSIYSAEESLYCKKPEYPYAIQNGATEHNQRFFVDAPATKFEPQKPNTFDTDYQDIFPVLNSDVMKHLETERDGEITQEGVNNVSEDCGQGRTSSLGVGIEYSSVWGSGKVTSSTPRDLIISEISVGQLRDVDEELRDFAEPWEGPKDYCPDDDEFFLSALPDPQKLFSVEDFSHLDETFPTTNFNFESLRPEDFGNMNAFDDKCLCDIRVGRDLDVLESTFNENFFVLQEKFPDVAHSGESHPDLYEQCTKSPRMSSPESRTDDQPKPRFKKGGRSSCSGRKEKAGCSKPNRKESIQSKMGVLVEGNSGKVDKKKLTSDGVAYHTRSISQKGIPIEYTLVQPKRIKKNKPA